MPAESRERDGLAVARVRFAAVLRSRRIMAGLTQRELAELAGVGVRTVRELEKARVRRPHHGTLALLAKALNLADLDCEAFIGTARPWKAPRLQAPVSVVSVWPPAPDGLPERAGDIAEVVTLLTMTRLVILTGCANAERVRLAGAVARECLVRYPAAAGAGFVAVGRDSGSEEILTMVATSLGVPRPADIPPRLANSAACLVVMTGLDRSPASAAGAVAWLRTWAPVVTVLATSSALIELDPTDAAEAVEWRMNP